MCRCGKGYCICSGTTYVEGVVDGLSVGYALGYECGYAHGFRAGYTQSPYERERAEREARERAELLARASEEARQNIKSERQIKLMLMERERQEYARYMAGIRSHRL